MQPVRATSRSAAPEQAAAPRRPSAAVSRPPRRGATRARLRRIFALMLLFLIAACSISYVGAMTKPSNTGLAVNSVEWLRDNGAAWLVSDVESFYYSLNAPSTGGPALKHLPKVGVAAGLSASTYRPPPIAPAITPALPGEGQWQ